MEKELKDLYKKLWDASIKKDKKQLDEVLSEDYILVHMTGMHQTKEEYIKSVLEGELKYFECIHEEIEVTINNGSATVIGKSKTLASPFGMTKSWWRLKQELIAEKRNGKWIFTHSIASTY